MLAKKPAGKHSSLQVEFEGTAQVGRTNTSRGDPCAAVEIGFSVTSAAKKQFGLVYRDPSEYVYVDLAKK